mmetsp:Transcript_11869/g.21930  ORF Transcript_11869/g.21930 Transcript_11869/m.21930 type:complete len:328 (+) Transcript_11869:498-1481(+)
MSHNRFKSSRRRIRTGTRERSRQLRLIPQLQMTQIALGSLLLIAILAVQLRQFPCGNSLAIAQRYRTLVALLGIRPSIQTEEASPDGTPHACVVGMQRSCLSEVKECVQQHVHDFVGLTETIPRSIFSIANVHGTSIGFYCSGSILHFNVLVPQQCPCAQIRSIEFECSLKVLHSLFVPALARVVITDDDASLWSIFVHRHRSMCEMRKRDFLILHVEDIGKGIHVIQTVRLPLRQGEEVFVCRIVIADIVICHCQLRLEVGALNKEPQCCCIIFTLSHITSILLLHGSIPIGQLFNDGNSILIRLILDKHMHTKEMIHPMIRDGEQ